MKKQKELTPYERARENFYRDHYLSMYSSGECDMGEHIDITCSCGYENRTYGSTTDVVDHVLSVVYGEDG